jgi:thiamine-monophosphate kinase
MVANISDIAAMGGTPLHALVTVVGPPGTDLDELYSGIGDAVRVYGCPVVGGDLSNGAIVSVSVSVTGTCDGEPVRRGGAHPGDVVFVSGPLGAAAAAGWTGRPVARVGEGTAARLAGASAMIDISVGLAGDLTHLADASGVGIDLHTVPVAPGATEQQALGGGEDFELVFTAPDPSRVLAGFAAAGLRVPIAIATCTADSTQRLAAAGWEHQWH